MKFLSIASICHKMFSTHHGINSIYVVYVSRRFLCVYKQKLFKNVTYLLSMAFPYDWLVVGRGRCYNILFKKKRRLLFKIKFLSQSNAESSPVYTELYVKSDGMRLEKSCYNTKPVKRWLIGILFLFFDPILIKQIRNASIGY